MSTENLSTAALHVVGQYNEAGKTLVSAYRTGAHRLIGGVASRYGKFVNEKVTGFLADRLDIDTSRVVNLMDRVAENATSGIESVAKAASRVEAPLGVSAINAFNRVHQPFADISVKIADTVAAGAKKIESRVAGAETSQKAETVKPKTTARRRTTRTSRALKA